MVARRVPIILELRDPLDGFDVGVFLYAEEHPRASSADSAAAG